MDETRARVFLAEGRAAEAEKLVRSAVQVLERGGEQSLLAEALTTKGLALARLGREDEAREVLGRAVEVAESAGDVEGAGQAALTLMEELGSKLAPHELSDTFERAYGLLAGSRHAGNKDRLLACARRVLYSAGVLQVPATWEGFSFMEAVRRYEARLIEAALTDADGVVTRAAQLLGLSRQSLDSMLRRRHNRLVTLRAPTEPRRSSLMFREGDCPDTRLVTILHAEDDEPVADAVRETLEAEGWQVEVCADGLAALERLAGSERYDLLIFDNQLPGISGIELTRQARSMAHRQQTPIIVLTASRVEAEARRAGANAFLRKPDDLPYIAETVARLLARKIKQ
ncbi:MAG TPA: response regulator [Pyrinomonadaceae bacterium]|nr:response regulator [Pyrinomonadaceae bacterium]